MNKFILKYITILFILLSITSCSNKENDSISTVKTGTNVTNSYEKGDLIKNDEYINEPTGLVCYDSMLYIVCKASDSICQYDYDGTFIKEIGKTGNGKCEFISPVLISIDLQGNLYIAEEGNKRIQVLNKNGEYIEEYSLKELDNIYCQLLDMEIDSQNNIYVSYKSFKEKKEKILIIDKNGNRIKVGKNLMGMFGTNIDKNMIFYAQTYELDKSSIITGTSFIANVENNKINKIVNLNNGYAPTDLIIMEDKLYVFSFGRNSIETFSFDGQYLETIYQGNIHDIELDFYYLTANEYGDIFATNQYLNEIYIFSKKE